MKTLSLYNKLLYYVWRGENMACKSHIFRNVYVAAVFKVSMNIPFGIATIAIIQIIFSYMIIIIITSSHLRLILDKYFAMRDLS